MNKIKNWMDKSFTNGTYVWLCLIGVAISALIYGVAIIYTYWDTIRSIPNMIKKRFRPSIEIEY